MRLSTNLVFLGLGLIGSALAKNHCCTPGCGYCMTQECGICTNIFFKSCCAESKGAVFFNNEEEYLATIVAGHEEYLATIAAGLDE